MKLTAADKKTLALMTNLAIEWESSLADSWVVDPAFATITKDRRERAAMIRKCEANIKRFKKLKNKLLGLSDPPALPGTRREP